MIRIEAPHFVAGVELRNETVVNSAPILRYMRGWSAFKVTNYCKRKGWKWARLHDST